MVIVTFAYRAPRVKPVGGLVRAAGRSDTVTITFLGFAK